MSGDAAVPVAAVVEAGSRVTLREHGRVHEVVVSGDRRPSHLVVDPDSVLGVALIGRRVGEEVVVGLGRGWPARVVVVEGVA